MRHDAVHLTLRLTANKYLSNPNNMPGTLLAAMNSEMEDPVSFIPRNVTHETTAVDISLYLQAARTNLFKPVSFLNSHFSVQFWRPGNAQAKPSTTSDEGPFLTPVPLNCLFLWQRVKWIDFLKSPSTSLTSWYYDIGNINLGRNPVLTIQYKWKARLNKIKFSK